MKDAVQGLQRGYMGKADAATAPNRGILQPLWKGEWREYAVQGLWRGYMGKADAATAPNRGFCCRCGKRDG